MHLFSVGMQLPPFADQSSHDLTLDVFAGPDSAFTLYEDDGASFDYFLGAFLRTQITRQQTRMAARASTANSNHRSSGVSAPPAT